MDYSIGVKIHNRFTVVLTDAKTGEVKQTAKAENIVCNTFLPYCIMSEMIRLDSYYNQSGMRSIVLGTGTGTPSVTDRFLFNQLIAYSGIPVSPGWTRKRLDENTCSYTVTVTADENTANGNLTEIGLGESHTYNESSTGWGTSSCGIYTHALFTDSEGNPITITKTNSDRLSITAIIYGTVITNNTDVYVCINSRTKNSSIIACDPRIPYVTGDDLYTTFDSSIIQSLTKAFQYEYVYCYPMTLPVYSAKSLLSLSTSYSKNVSTRTVRNETTTRVLANQSNFKNPTTTMIRSFRCNGVFTYLPNANIYPGRQFTLTTTADGQSTGFNFKIPELRTTDVEVYINDVLQSADTYTFSGLDYTHVQGWKSFDSLYLSSFDLTAVKNDESGSTGLQYYLAHPVFNGIYDYYSRTTSNSEVGIFIYDFKTEYTVSAVGKYLPTGVYTEAATRFVPRLYYSNDKENWTQVTGLWNAVSNYLAAANISTPNGYLSVTPISARYWKVENPVIRTKNVRSDSIAELACSLVFGDPKPQLQFNTAPPEGATITVKAYCDYPIKNSNWIVEPGMTFDLTIAMAD